MNELTNHIQRIMKPKAVLIAYEYKVDSYSRAQNYLELRPINTQGQMGAGVPVTYEFMNTLLESYTEEMSGIPHGCMPFNAVVRLPERKGEIHLVQSTTEAADVFCKITGYSRRDIRYAGNTLYCLLQPFGSICLQGRKTGGRY